jgi:hypothetical protein
VFSRLLISTVMLAGVAPAEAGPLAVSPESLTGTWECGPTTMQGPQLVMSITSVGTFAADRTFVAMTTNVIKPNGRSAVTVVNSSRGTWRLEGTTLIWVYQESKFISASDPIISAERGQKVEDDEMRKKSVYKSEILEISRESMRRIPVDSAYAAAVVETRCKRTSD